MHFHNLIYLCNRNFISLIFSTCGLFWFSMMWTRLNMDYPRTDCPDIGGGPNTIGTMIHTNWEQQWMQKIQQSTIVTPALREYMKGGPLPPQHLLDIRRGASLTYGLIDSVTFKKKKKKITRLDLILYYILA